MRVKVNDGKTKDVAITDVTPENYIVPSNEQYLYPVSYTHLTLPTILRV